MAELRIQMIPVYSPQARGRGECSFATWQGRRPQELWLHGIKSLASANEFLRESYIAEFNQRFALAPAQPGHAFLSVRGKNLDLIFALQHERTVNQDNTVHLGSCILQIEKSCWRAILAGCRVTVYQHLDRTWSIGYGPHLVGTTGTACRCNLQDPNLPDNKPKPDTSGTGHFSLLPTVSLGVKGSGWKRKGSEH